MRTGMWFLLAAVLALVNVAWFVWADAPLLERQAGAEPVVPQPAAMPSPAQAVVESAAPVSAAPTADGSVAQSDMPASSPAPTPAASSSPAVGDAPTGLLIPVQGAGFETLTDTFDEARGSERRHEALDIMAPEGTPVLAVADGTIEKLFDSERGGLTIYQFEPTGRYAYYYAHLQAYAPGIVEGQPVRRGDVLGTVGSTGNADPAAPHLHFAVFRLTPEKQWWVGEPINPYPLLARPE